MKKNEKPHSLHISFVPKNDTVELVETHCSCAAGSSESCSHVVALAYFLQDQILRKHAHISEDLSATSLPCEWIKPRGAAIQPEKIVSAIFCKPTKVVRKKTPIKSTLRDPARNSNLHHIPSDALRTLKNSLRTINGGIPVTYLLNDNTAAFEQVDILPGVDVPRTSVLGLKMYAEAEIKEVFSPLTISLPQVHHIEIINILISRAPVHHSTLKVLSFEDADAIQKNTQDQSNNTLWHYHRLMRFTALKFSMICKRRLFNDKLKAMFTQSGPNIAHVPQIKHGREKEAEVRTKYSELNPNVQVFKCGLVVHPYALHLGASPDGILLDVSMEGPGVLEIKCPHCDTLEDYLLQRNCCLKSDENSTLRLKINHEYNYQVQGQMLICGLLWADFIVYISKSTEVVRDQILIDPQFCATMYHKLTEIYAKCIQTIHLDEPLHCS